MKLIHSTPVRLGIGLAAFLVGAHPVLAAPYLGLNVGNPGLAGTAVESGGTLTLEGSGADIWGTSDQFYLHYVSLPGEGSVVARVASLENTDPWAKAGVMIRATGEANSIHAFMGVTAANGLAFQHRTVTGGGSEHVGTAGSAPRWVRLTRKSNYVTAAHSVNGLEWTQVGWIYLNPSDQVLAGLAVTSHNNATLATAVFDNVMVQQGAANLDFQGTWTDNGNGDGWPNPGEELTLSVRVRNGGSVEARTVTGTLGLDDPYATLISGQADFGTIPAGEFSEFREFRFRVAPNAPSLHSLSLPFALKDALGEVWGTRYQFVVAEPLSVSGTVRWENGNPVVGATVRCHSKTAGGFQITDAQGRYTLSLKSPGGYGCFAELNDRRSQEVSITVPPSLMNQDFTLYGSIDPNNWTSLDIGNPGLTGGHSQSGNVLSVTGSGEDIWGAADQFHFVYRPLIGNGEITARVTSVSNTDAWAKAGVMIRESLAADSRHAFTAMTAANGLTFQRRTATGGQSFHTGISGGTPCWVRLRREGDVFISSMSMDGSNWTEVGRETIAMGTAAWVGLAVSSHNNAATTVATFESSLVY
ncbi:MAG TPA: carboxypeptidase regulatory-like domain-containing protein [Fibrobacteria bacterium]|nr:carboxypeptidase regulatory-like domain-containing protein [Fibrobacteria bacterium]